MTHTPSLEIPEMRYLHHSRWNYKRVEEYSLIAKNLYDIRTNISFKTPKSCLQSLDYLQSSTQLESLNPLLVTQARPCQTITPNNSFIYVIQLSLFDCLFIIGL